MGCATGVLVKIRLFRGSNRRLTSEGLPSTTPVDQLNPTKYYPSSLLADLAIKLGPRGLRILADLTGRSDLSMQLGISGEAPIVADNGIETEAAGKQRRPGARWLNRRTIFLATALAATMVYAQYQFWDVPERGDCANWDYFAQVITRGGIPYRDVVNIKSPLSAYIGAAGIVATRPFGLRDILAIRFVYLGLAILTVCFTFLVAANYFNSIRIGVVAAVILLGIDKFLTLNSAGIQPKTPMVLFGLVSLWAVLKDKPLIAGLFGALSCLSWQPGLLFVGAAGLAFSRYLTSWRDKKILWLLIGVAAPATILVGYLWFVGALRDFYVWGFHYPSTVYGPREAKNLGGFVDRFLQLLRGPYGSDAPFFYLAAAGLAALILVGIWVGKRKGITSFIDGAPSHAIVISPVVYFAFCMMDIQRGPDLIPLLPFVGAFSAFLLVASLDTLMGLIRRTFTGLPLERLRAGGFAILLGFVVYASVGDAARLESDLPTLRQQDEAMKEVASLLKPGDKIFAHGQTELLVLSGLTNASKYFFLDRGKDTYLNEVEPGGFDGWFERLKRDRPKIVGLSRLNAVDYADRFRQWVQDEYEVRETRAFSYYLRLDDSPLDNIPSIKKK